MPADQDHLCLFSSLLPTNCRDPNLPAHSRVGRSAIIADFCSWTCKQVYAVIDLGTVVNPDTVKAQVEGAAVMALTAAIKNGITFNQGKTVQTNYHNNPLVRINEMPKVEVHILANGGSKIKGVGEPGLPPFAPALCNAIYAATGKRIRRLPFDINNI